ncbi:MAG TPA: hypothetical protein VK914_05840 [bacterium]|jgi:hypothetical protein|nr:hypothetical protein [bacterium]
MQSNNQSRTVNLELGDRIFCWSLLKKHYGVFNGGGWVLHNMPGKGEHFVSFEEFRAGRQVFIEKKCPPEKRPKVMAALQAKAGNPKRYDLLVHNCEHTALEATEGVSASYQVRGWGTIGSIALIALLLV